MSKILVSMLAYREKDLLGAVRSLWDNAYNKDGLIFSIVSEQSKPELHADLSFIPKDQLVYHKLDLSEYRGVMWSRWKTSQVELDYDYFFQTCGHNIFVKDWDLVSIKEYNKAKEMAGHDKVILTVSGAEYSIASDGRIMIDDVPSGRTQNSYHRHINDTYIPGYGFPDVTWFTDDLLEPAVYWQGSYIFTTKNYLNEVPFDPDMSYHGEEIYLTIQSWCRGWRFWATPKIIYYHLTVKKYPGEANPRHVTHRPWADQNKVAFWEQSSRSMIKLNKLLSGNLEGEYGNISLDSVLDYCRVSGLNRKWTMYDPKYDKLGLYQMGLNLKNSPPVLLD